MCAHLARVSNIRISTIIRLMKKFPDRPARNIALALLILSLSVFLFSTLWVFYGYEVLLPVGKLSIFSFLFSLVIAPFLILFSRNPKDRSNKTPKRLGIVSLALGAILLLLVFWLLNGLSGGLNFNF